jgi:hypothetical protein
MKHMADAVLCNPKHKHHKIAVALALGASTLYVKYNATLPWAVENVSSRSLDECFLAPEWKISLTQPTQ